MQNGIPNRDTDCILEIEVQEPEGEKGMISFFYQKSTYKKFWSYAHPFSKKQK